MPDESGSDGDWRALLAGVRSGDNAAVEAFVARYEPFLHRIVRVRGAVRQLQAVAESQDVVQSVIIKALRDIAAGQAVFSDEAALENYLATLGRHNLRDKIRRETAAKRGGGMTRVGEVSDRPGDPTPSQIVSAKEEIARVEAVAPAADLDILRQKLDGAEWNDLAATQGVSPEALRKRLERVRKQIRKALDDGED